MPEIPSRGDEQSAFHRSSPASNSPARDASHPSHYRRPRRRHVYHTGEYTDQPAVRRASRIREAAPNDTAIVRRTRATRPAPSIKKDDFPEYADEFFDDEEEMEYSEAFADEVPASLLNEDAAFIEEAEDEDGGPTTTLSHPASRASRPHTAKRPATIHQARRHLAQDEDEQTPITFSHPPRKEDRDLVVISGTTRFLVDDDEVEDEDDREAMPTRLPETPAPRYRPAMSRPRYTDVYEPPSRPRHAPRYRRPYREAPASTSKARLPRLLTNHYVLAISAVALLILVILPLGLNFARGNTPSKLTITSLFDTGNSNATPTADPNKIVVDPPNTEHPSPPVYASAAYVLDAKTGKTLYAHNPLVHLPMLSTTKLMTAYLAATLGDPNQRITITATIDRDLQEGLSPDSSLMGIKKGETYTLKELLYGLMLVSGNDAAIAIADAISGNVPAFVAKMNHQLEVWDLHNTHYMNPHGLMENNHYSSAHDLAIIGKYSLSNPLIHQISATQHYTIDQNRSHRAHNLYNGNQFLWWYPGVDGGKPGWDGLSNFNQVVSVTRDNRHLIGVTLNTKDWWTDMRDLMNWGLNDYTWVSPAITDRTHPIPYDADWNYFAKDKKENTIPTSNGGRYYIYTGYSISNPVQRFFDKNGGLGKFGFPVSSPKPGDNATVSQKFEHATIQCQTTGKQTCHRL